MADNSTKLFSSWFCPFAQRTWITLLEKGIDFELKEIDPYNKTPEFLAMNPRGLVPTLLHNGKSVYESLIIDEYINEVWPQEPKLMPEDPYQRAQARIWIDFIGKKIVPTFYFILQKQTTEEQEQGKTRLLESLRSFATAMSDEGPYFFGEGISLVDITLIPFAIRFDILAHYRQFSLPSDGSLDRIQVWLDACMSRLAVQKTLAPADKMLDIYKRYADDKAKSQVAEAIRTGNPLP